MEKMYIPQIGDLLRLEEPVTVTSDSKQASWSDMVEVYRLYRRIREAEGVPVPWKVPSQFAYDIPKGVVLEVRRIYISQQARRNHITFNVARWPENQFLTPKKYGGSALVAQVTCTVPVSSLQGKVYKKVSR